MTRAPAYLWTVTPYARTPNTLAPTFLTAGFLRKPNSYLPHSIHGQCGYGWFLYERMCIRTWPRTRAWTQLGKTSVGVAALPYWRLPVQMVLLKVDAQEEGDGTLGGMHLIHTRRGLLPAIATWQHARCAPEGDLGGSPGLDRACCIRAVDNRRMARATPSPRLHVVAARRLLLPAFFLRYLAGACSIFPAAVLYFYPPQPDEPYGQLRLPHTLFFPRLLYR